MLLKFKVGNYRSYDKVQEFSMIRGNTRSLKDHVADKNGVNILKNAAIFGPNASGKSALVDAIAASKAMILGSFDSIPNIRRRYCRISEDNRSKPSYFEFIIETDNETYSYGFEIVLSECVIRNEWLIKLNPSNETEEIIFERDTERPDELEFGKMFNKDELSRLNTYSSDISGKTGILFLSEMNRKNFGNNVRLNIFHQILNWFINKLMVNRMIAPDRESISHAGRILSDLDTDISDVKFQDMDQTEIKRMNPVLINSMEQMLYAGKDVGQDFIIQPDGLCFELSDNGRLKISKASTIHSSSDSCFDISEESTGTLAVFNSLSMLTSNKDDITYVIDEFGGNLHPLMSNRFIELFQEHNSNMSNQMIITTHETSLMTLDLYRRDEIWFIEKENGASEIYSLEGFQERFDRKLSKAYMEGRYGAIPSFSRLFGTRGENEII